MNKMSKAISDISIPVECLYATNSTRVREPTANECRFARFAGSLLLLVSIISFVTNISALRNRQKNRLSPCRNLNLVIGMFASSMCVIVISVPSVAAQCFLCRRLCIPIICHIEGFNSFLNGCVTMYMLVALSFVRYSTTANSSLSIYFQRQLEERNSQIVFLCFVIGGIWAIPPLFGHMSSYVPEGLGFHCGLDWFDRSLAGRIYFFLLFIGVFFIPMAIVIYVNIYIKQTVHRLTHIQSSVLLDLHPKFSGERMRRHVSAVLHEKENRRLQRLQEDRRFVVATGISVVFYIIAWTPYSVVALSQVFGDVFSLYNPWLMTTCALLAKLSMITNPIIYTITLKSHHKLSNVR